MRARLPEQEIQNTNKYPFHFASPEGATGTFIVVVSVEVDTDFSLVTVICFGSGFC